MSLLGQVQSRITEAQDRLQDAEQELSKVINALDVNERADKKMIGDSLRKALDRVAKAKETLVELLNG